MNDDYCITGKFIFEELSSDSIMKGVLLLTSKEAILLDGVEVALYRETRGRVSSNKSSLFGFTIARNVKLEKNMQQEIPFQFSFKDHFFETYVGLNFSSSYICEATLRINKADLDKVDLSFYEKMKGLIFSGSPFVLSSDYELKYPNYKYQIVESAGNFEIQSGEIPAIITVIIGVLATLIVLKGDFVAFVKRLFEIPIDNKVSYFLIGFLLFLFLSLVLQLFVRIFYKILGIFLGEIHVDIKKSEDDFKCILSKPSNLKLENRSLCYDIVEEVVDNRGTSSTTYKEVIFSSLKKQVSGFEKSKEIQLGFPDRTGLESRTVKDISIYWELILEGRYLGLNIKYTYVFFVMVE